MTTTELAGGVPTTEAYRLVAETAPDLVEAWEAAREACAQHDPAWHRRNHNFQRDRNIPRRQVTSPHGEALAIAEVAVREKFEAMLAAGVVCYAGYPSGQLDGDPQAIPISALGRRRPSVASITVEGTTFYRVKLYPTDALAEQLVPHAGLLPDDATAPEPEPEPDPVTDPPPTDDRLVEALADLFAEDQAWETLGPAKLAPIVAQRDRRFRPGNGIWSAATLADKIKTHKQTAKAEARARGAI